MTLTAGPVASVVRGAYLIAGDAVLEHGAFYQERGTIRQVARYDELRARHPDVPVVGSEDVAVLPGFVNAHQHGRGMTHVQLGDEDDALETWLTGRFAGNRSDRYLDTLDAALTMLRSGITTAVHHHSYRGGPGYLDGLTAALRAYEDAGIRIAFFPSISKQNLVVYGDIEDLLPHVSRELAEELRRATGPQLTISAYFELVDELRSRSSAGDRITFGYSPGSAHWCEDDDLLAIRSRAEREGAPVHTHLLESPYQAEYALRKYGMTHVAHLARVGFLFRGLSCAHAVWTTRRDVALLADRSVGVAHNPSENLRLRSGMAPVAEMLEQGLTVGLGTDGETLNDNEDFFEEMRLAWRLHRLPGIGTPNVRASDIWRMATTGGARLLMLGDRVGSLTTGFRADALLLDIRQLRAPHGDEHMPLLDRILYRSSRDDVRTVLVDGRVVFDAGAFPGIDHEQVEHRLEESVTPLTDAQRDLGTQLRAGLARYYAGWLGGPGNRPSHYPVNEDD